MCTSLGVRRNLSEIVKCRTTSVSHCQNWKSNKNLCLNKNKYPLKGKEIFPTVNEELIKGFQKEFRQNKSLYNREKNQLSGLRVV